MCGMIADAIISGANPIPGAIRWSQIVTAGPRADVDLATARVPARSRVPANQT
jgi:hypothetical protein